MKLKLKFKIKSYHIENMGGGTLAYFGQFKNGLYFAGNETGFETYTINVWQKYYSCVEITDKIEKEMESYLVKIYDENNKISQRVMKEINF